MQRLRGLVAAPGRVAQAPPPAAATAPADVVEPPTAIAVAMPPQPAGGAHGRIEPEQMEAWERDG
ncbi:MAG TPA: hypothetical protein VLK29_13155, partial [Luteimonas sp.]|nr:hypothetical protein [Luteimonas sp.]